MDELSAHAKTARSEPRDSEGHFIHVDQPLPGTSPEEQTPQSASPSPHPASPEPAERVVMDALIPRGVSLDHKADDNTLLDVHLGNPLRRIQQLLEEIKAQKAFSFTLKGSLGIAGIALVITTFGIFGGTEAFCSRGTQSEIGTLRMLSMDEQTAVSLPAHIAAAWDSLWGRIPQAPGKRLVLIKQDKTVLRVAKSPSVALATDYFSSPVIVTGDYDSCSQTLSVSDPHAIQSY